MRRDVSSVALNGMGVDLLGVRICDISVFFLDLLRDSFAFRRIRHWVISAIWIVSSRNLGPSYYSPEDSPPSRLPFCALVVFLAPTFTYVDCSGAAAQLKLLRYAKMPIFPNHALNRSAYFNCRRSYNA